MKGLYVHVPFCVKKCKYCDFASGPSGERERAGFTDALIREILRRGATERETIGTVFIGGGTPTVLSPMQLTSVTEALREFFSIAEGAEFTVEANPDSLTQDKAEALIGAGVNRLSIGFQSLSPRALGVLGRIHTAERALAAFKTARRAGFSNVNVDLIFGIPGEPEGEFEATLREVLALRPEHISAYSLIVEDGTALKREIDEGVTEYPSDERDRSDYHLAAELLANAGYEHYEISNFALEGFQSRHNRLYWEQGEYIGLGPAAASFENGRRYSNSPDTEEYIRSGGRPAASDSEVLSADGLMKEFMMLGFRLTDGPDLRRFREKFGVSAETVFSEELKKLTADGLITHVNDCDRPYALTVKGLDYANEIFRAFV